MKRTLWYPASIDPVRAGYYEVSYWGTMPPEERYWNGNTWLYHKASVYCLFGQKESDKWRGLTAPQKPLSDEVKP